LCRYVTAAQGVTLADVRAHSETWGDNVLDGDGGGGGGGGSEGEDDGKDEDKDAADGARALTAMLTAVGLYTLNSVYP
jgi:hypothetical protein